MVLPCVLAVFLVFVLCVMPLCTLSHVYHHAQLSDAQLQLPVSAVDRFEEWMSTAVSEQADKAATEAPAFTEAQVKAKKNSLMGQLNYLKRVPKPTPKPTPTADPKAAAKDSAKDGEGAGSEATSSSTAQEHSTTEEEPTAAENKAATEEEPTAAENKAATDGEASADEGAAESPSSSEDEL
jgi:hypothetical protein